MVEPTVAVVSGLHGTASGGAAGDYFAAFAEDDQGLDVTTLPASEALGLLFDSDELLDP